MISLVVVSVADELAPPPCVLGLQDVGMSVGVVDTVLPLVVSGRKQTKCIW